MNNGRNITNNDVVSIDKIKYNPPYWIRQTQHKKSISVIGLDTETFKTGKCFLICTSEGDHFTLDDTPEFFFRRKYINKKFVVWNIKFDESSILQILPKDKLNILRTTNKVEHEGFKYKSIPHKMLSISKGKNAIEIYDIMGFYHMSLEKAATKYLGKHKLDVKVDGLTFKYVRDNLDTLIKYCIQDCVLTKELANLMIRKFEDFGVYPQKLYSTAYVSFQYFKAKCNIPLVKNIYDNHPQCLQMAIESYNGGKFEVTQKGSGEYWEYDIISAYPFEISNLIDIRHAYVIRSNKYRKGAVYGFLRCFIKIPEHIYSPLALKKGTLNIYPVGEFQKTITKTEYEYLVSTGCDIKILDAYWLHVANKTYPFKREINNLIKKKTEYKEKNLDLDYHTIKIFLNSLYGKFVQLIKKDDKFIAGINWNIIYGSVITANCRIKVSQLQQKYESVIAVHTDSIISYKKLNFPKKGSLGDIIYDCSGAGVILGSGIYQVGSKTKFRGFTTKLDLIDLLSKSDKKLEIDSRRPFSWREVVFHNWDLDMINRFKEVSKTVNLRFDKKRVWIDDYETFSEVLKRPVYSAPIPIFNYLTFS